MHMDKVAARRTQAGAPVVHGVHLTLWTLDTLIAAGVITTTITIGLGPPKALAAGAMDQPPAVTRGHMPNEPELAAMAKQSGWIEPQGNAAAALFPHAAALLGARRVGAIALASRPAFRVRVAGLRDCAGPSPRRPGI